MPIWKCSVIFKLSLHFGGGGTSVYPKVLLPSFTSNFSKQEPSRSRLALWRAAGTWGKSLKDQLFLNLPLLSLPTLLRDLNMIPKFPGIFLKKGSSFESLVVPDKKIMKSLVILLGGFAKWVGCPPHVNRKTWQQVCKLVLFLSCCFETAPSSQKPRLYCLVLFLPEIFIKHYA